MGEEIIWLPLIKDQARNVWKHGTLIYDSYSRKLNFLLMLFNCRPLSFELFHVQLIGVNVCRTVFN